LESTTAVVDDVAHEGAVAAVADEGAVVLNAEAAAGSADLVGSDLVGFAAEFGNGRRNRIIVGIRYPK